MELLPMYNFVVTQDEDYLNLICHNKVCWLPQKWNVEVFGQIPCREEEICVLHYIMVSKPWHYSDCRLQEYFGRAHKRPVCMPRSGRCLKAIQTKKESGMRSPVTV